MNNQTQNNRQIYLKKISTFLFLHLQFMLLFFSSFAATQEIESQFSPQFEHRNLGYSSLDHDGLKVVVGMEVF